MAEKVLLAGVRLGAEDKERYLHSFDELRLLARTAGGVVAGELIQHRQSPDPKCFIGEGKVEEIKALAAESGATLVIFNEELRPSQQKNLEDLLDIRILDRVGLILDIFSQRARTGEARLQVELAQYQYLLPRLTRMWTHFSQQSGYIGTRGPGETQLEVDKRRIGDRIRLLKKKTAEVHRHHTLLRTGRQKKGMTTISLVGYTNAGKSTLMNALTRADVLVENKLFATLDPTVKQWYLPELPSVVLTDTVGFIQRLPHLLVNAFKATQDEVVEADLLLHVIDASSPLEHEQIEAVFRVLEEIGAVNKPMVMVFNKIDQLSPARLQQLKSEAHPIGAPAVFISALNGEGLDQLTSSVSKMLSKATIQASS